jgi:hypothetical protein
MSPHLNLFGPVYAKIYLEPFACNCRYVKEIFLAQAGTGDPGSGWFSLDRTRAVAVLAAVRGDSFGIIQVEKKETGP